MFMLRSAFWLGLAFVIVHPSFDMDKAGSQALAAGRSVAEASVNAMPCSTLECAGAKIMVTAALTSAPDKAGSSPAIPQTVLPAITDVPYPAPRLVRKG